MDGSDGEPDYRFHMGHPERYGNFHVASQPISEFRSSRGLFGRVREVSKEDEELHLVLGTIEQPGEGRYKERKSALQLA